jgi:periplasmic mercuric ion binding protein
MKKICWSMAMLLVSCAAQAETIEMKVFGMVCGFCAQGIEASLRKNPATVDVVVSLEKQLVVVETRPGIDIPDKDLKAAITSAGYDLKTVARTTRTMAQVRGELEGKPAQ